MRISRKIAALGVTAAAVTAGALVNAGPAYAALYGGQCGSGYNIVNLADFSRPPRHGVPDLQRVHREELRRHQSGRSRGTATLMEAYVRRSGNTAWIKESDNFTTYAGPVYVSAAGSCVDWGGTIGTASQTRYGTNCG